MMPDVILADATPGVLYARNTYYKNSYEHTSLWVSFDYGENWIFREENIGSKGYSSANIEGLIYRGGNDGLFSSTNFGLVFENIPIPTPIYGVIGESGLSSCEFWNILGSNPYSYQLVHTTDCRQTYNFIPIDSQYMFGSMQGISPSIYCGSQEGEVYITSWFPGYTYKVSFSTDTGHTFRHVYINDDYNAYSLYKPVFMSDREPGVFYIIRGYEVEDFNPWGWHIKLCVDYFRDYGETLEATFCHDITKDYEYEEVICSNTTCLESVMVNFNSIQLQWANSAESEFIRGYHVYRNNVRITNQLLTTVLYLDENLPNGNYEYYVRTYYKEGCVSDKSNTVIETIEIIETCEVVNDLASEKPAENSVLLTWSAPEEELEIEGYSVYRNDTLLTEELTSNISYLDENLPNGDYKYYVVAHYTNGCISDSSNHVMETVFLRVNEVAGVAGVVVYPNPTTGELNVVVVETRHALSLQIQNVEIFDIYGRTVLSSMSPLSQQHSLNISHLQAGIYFVRVATDKGVVMRKVVKQ